MMSVAKPVPVLSPNEYLLKEQQGEIKHEYINGSIFSLTSSLNAPTVGETPRNKPVITCRFVSPGKKYTSHSIPK